MLEDFNIKNLSINRIEYDFQIYFSRDKEFIEIAERCDTKFIDEPEKLYQFTKHKISVTMKRNLLKGNQFDTNSISNGNCCTWNLNPGV